ncbi:hypothetical protein A7K99_09175 [Tatumella citrea]|uniref:Uncharacterized protein n=1 Tax=Tatumella citrea TaxID=53336 RepID=A0A1Y0L7C1_TATCI|nr:hypothetical protein A7K98_09175 [Tatumella citrea]ARU97970.1 hypothetical protein A7K99_09175 [Tatumella citrea]
MSGSLPDHAGHYPAQQTSSLLLFYDSPPRIRSIAQPGYPVIRSVPYTAGRPDYRHRARRFTGPQAR